MTTPPVTSFTVEAEDRIDRAVVQAMPELSRSQVRRLIEEGHVAVNGQVILKPAHPVAPGASLRVEQPVLAHLEVAADEVPLDVIFEDEETLVLNKQPGIIVHPREGVRDVTLINAVRARYPEVREINDTDRGGVVHRLDRDTSGVIVIAKSEASQFALKEQWRNRETEKYYIALVAGYVDPPEGIIEAALGPDPDDPRRRAVLEYGKSARSQYRVLEQYGDEAALLEVRIFTGRTHQIRVHLQAIGHPVLSDHLYGHPSEHIERQALHAWRLGVTLASNGAWHEFVAPVPDDIRAAIRSLRTQHRVPPSEIGDLV